MLLIGLDDGTAFEGFRARVDEERRKLMSFLENAKAEGQAVCGLGASTKGNVLLQYYGITPDLISVIGEVNPDKFGCVTPGTNIPIAPQDDVLATDPDYLMDLPWHFEPFFTSSPKFRGRKLVFPLPCFRIIDR